MNREIEGRAGFQFFSLRRKLLFFFVAFFCLMLLTAGYIALAHRGTADLLDTLLGENETLEEAGDKLHLLEHYTTNYLNSASQENYELYRQSYQNLEELKTAGEVNSVTEFKELIAGILAASEGLIEQRDNEQDYQEKYQVFTGQIDITSRYLNNVINDNNRQANQIYAQSWDLINQMERYGLLMAAVLALFSMAFLYIFTENITRPLYRIIAQSRELAEGNFSLSPIQVETRDELNFIARAFNLMTAELEALFTELQEKLALERELQQKQVENLKMKNLVKEAELKKLQSQINPHFLFNTLNSISQLAVLEDADRTGEMITKVAQHFRRNLKRTKELITVAEELESVHLYCDILKTRFGDTIEFDFNYQKEVLQEKIPPLTIQPLVENAFVHGIKKGGNSTGRITVTLKQQQDWLLIEVQDDGSGMEEELVERIFQREEIGGLSNIRERLRLFYQRDDLLNIKGAAGEGTRVTIDIPLTARAASPTAEEESGCAE